MRNFFTIAILALSISAFAQLPAYNWGFSLGTLNDDYHTDLITDHDGNIYITGFTTLMIDMDPGPGSTIVGVTGLQNCFLAKYDPEGNLDWAMAWSGGGYQLGMDQNNNVIITGIFTNTTTIGTQILTSLGWDDIFLASVSPGGTVNWAFSFGGVEPDQPTALTIGPGGDIFLGGRTKLDVDFDPGPGSFILNGLGLYDGFFARYTDQGQFVWAKMFTTSADEEVSHIESDNNGLLYVGGTFRLPMDFSLGAGNPILTPIGINDHFIAAYDTAGTFQWARQFGGVGNSSILFSGLGNNWNSGPAIAVSGNFLDTLYIGTSSMYDAYGPVDIYTLVYDNSGNLLTSFTLGGAGAFGFAGELVVQDNELIQSGSFSGTVDLDPRASLDTMFTASSQKDAFLVRYSESLEPLGIYMWEGTGEDYAFQLTMDAGENLLLGVRFEGTLYQQPLAQADPAISLGGIDFSIIKLGNSIIPSGLEQNDPGSFLMHPVPAKDYFNIQTSSLLVEGNLTVYNSSGLIVYTQAFSHETYIKTVDTSTWPIGIYFVKVQTDKGDAIQKLIIAR
ncbi:MAG: T9SS type A sorting domain-containing protein [Bacteroidales bacterium]|nr:T9SS type A sorting domain-containing protein [Bacteroidales bacterium]